LVATSTVAQADAGRIVASTLATQTSGGLSLGGDNQLGRLTAANSDGGAIAVNHTGALEIAGITQTQGGDVTIANDGAITLSGAVRTQDEVHLVSGAGVGATGDGRIVDAARLTVESAAGIDLAGENEVFRLVAIDTG